MSWDDAPTRERGRPARMLFRYVPLSSPAMRHLAQLHLPLALQSTKDAPPRTEITLRGGEKQCLGKTAPPGSAGVPPACTPVTYRSVSLECGTRHNFTYLSHFNQPRTPPPRTEITFRGGEKQCRRKTAPPGSAGVPPACTSVTYRSVSLECGTRHNFAYLSHFNQPTPAPQLIV